MKESSRRSQKSLRKIEPLYEGIWNDKFQRYWKAKVDEIVSDYITYGEAFIKIEKIRPKVQKDQPISKGSKR